jgi:hypothetical protein
MVKKICGISNIELPEIGSDPNFVFTNDPLFDTIVLYSSEGNVINVNSWIECAHYVKGGWSNTLIVGSGNEIILYGLILCYLSYFIVKKFLVNNAS